MHNISYPLLNKLNRLIIVITSKCCWSICMLYTYKYNTPVFTWIQVTYTQLTRSAHKLCWWGCGVCCYGDVYCFFNTATSRPGMLDICLLASDPSPIDSLSLSLPFVLCNAIDVSLASHYACSIWCKNSLTYFSFVLFKGHFIWICNDLIQGDGIVRELPRSDIKNTEYLD